MSEPAFFDNVVINIFKTMMYGTALVVAAPVVLAYVAVGAIATANRNRINYPPQTKTTVLEAEAKRTAYPDTESFTAEVAKRFGRENPELLPHINIFVALSGALSEVFERERPVLPTPPVHPDLIQTARYRDTLRKHIELGANAGTTLEAIASCFVEIFTRAMNALPPNALQTRQQFKANDDEGTTVPLIDMLANPADAVKAIIYPFYGDKLENAFPSLKAQFDRNLCTIARLPYEPASLNSPKLIFPDAYEGTGRDMARAYLRDTPFEEVLLTEMPFAIPPWAWLTHGYILGSTGSGKTQLIQSLILDWLKYADPPSLIVIDSQGEMLAKIAQLEIFNTRLRDRLVIIDPEDDEPPSLNMFDMQTPRLATYNRNIREQVEASVIELYTYLFGALDSQLTSKQSTAFTFVARLMLAIPDATIHTFRALMEDKEPSEVVARYIATLDRTAQEFFERQFFTKAFSETREQVARRLYDFLRVPAFDRLFSSPRNTLDMFEAMQSGKIILVNTSKALLKGASALFGRYMIMQVLAAAYERVAIPEDERRPAFLFVDEAHEYFDKSLADILTQARKFRVGLICAHQTLDQASPDIRSALVSNTTVKLVGSLSDRDARALASDMRTTADALSSVGTDSEGATFNCFVRNYTPHALHLKTRFGALEAEPKMTREDYRALLASNRATYAYRPPIALPAPDVTTEDNTLTAPQSTAVDPAW